MIDLTTKKATMSLVETRYEPIVLDDAAVPLISKSKLSAACRRLRRGAFYRFGKVISKSDSGRYTISDK